MLVISALGGWGEAGDCCKLKASLVYNPSLCLNSPISSQTHQKKNPPKKPKQQQKNPKNKQKTPPNQKKPQTNKKKAKIKYQIEHLKPQNIFTSQRRNQFV